MAELTHGADHGHGGAGHDSHGAYGHDDAHGHDHKPDLCIAGCSARTIRTSARCI